MSAPKFVNNFKNYMFKNYSQDDGKLLVHMGALSWVFGAFAQVGAVLCDKNIDKKKKKFLLPQEAADAGANVVLFYTVCDLIKKGSDKLVESGKLLTQEAADAIKALKPNAKTWNEVFTASELKQNLTDLLKDGSKLKVFNGKPLTQAQSDAVKKALEAVESHKNNMGIIAAIGASVLACNIITPYVRNFIAAKWQKNQLHKEAVETRKCQIRENITMRNPLPHSFKSFNNYNSFSGIKI